MSKTSPASSIITRVARDVLRPLGLRQQGRSRLWFDDHGWWLVVVEFQPSAWSQGSYLNVSPMWLWHRSEHFWFTPEARIHEHVELRDEAQFAVAARRLATLARDRVLELRAQLSTLDAVAEHLRATPIASGGWPAYHAGLAAALTGDVTQAGAAFDAFLSTDPTHDTPVWRDLRRQVAELRDQLRDRDAVRSQLSEVVADSRRLLKLDALTTPAFP